MARNTVSVDQVVNDFVLTMDGDDFVAGSSNTVIRNFALRGIREMGFDMLKRIRSIKLTVNSSLNTVDLPDDFVDLCKIGMVGSDGLIYVFGENKNLNYSQVYKEDVNGNPIDSDSDGVYDRVDAKTITNDMVGFKGYDSYIFRNYLYESTEGRLYGVGGGQFNGEYRMNYDQNRIELNTTQGITDVAIEYIADEARSTNPSIHQYAESALRAYIYYKLIERKSTVPANEKMRARQEYYNERRIANSRLKSFSKEEALKTIRKNFYQAPKY
jgi:hypothetical protein